MRYLDAILTAVIALALVLAGCDSDLTSPEAPSEDARQGALSSSMMNSNAPFPVFHQGFNHDTEPWSQFTEQSTWCGSIEQVNRGEGDVRPSAGRGYATVEHGRCAGDFPPVTSAPASGPELDLMSNTWPASGFVQQIDVYLDPAEYSAETDGPDYDNPENGVIEGLVFAPEGGVVEEVDGVVFTFAASVCLLDEGTCDVPGGLRYVSVPVWKERQTLEVAGQTVAEAGWYTFRFVFDSAADGTLTADFELVKDGRTLATESIEHTRTVAWEEDAEPISDLQVDDLGSGYLWFASIADGLELPIDEHLLRRGK